MKNEFTAVLESVLQYEQSQATIISVVAVVMLSAFCLIVFRKHGKVFKANKITISLILAAMCVVFSLCAINYAVYREKVLSDISEENYTVYRGEFTHDDYQKDSFYHNIYIIDDTNERIVLRYPDYANYHQTYTDFSEFPIGTFTGTIIYSEDSRIVVDWNITTEAET